VLREAATAVTEATTDKRDHLDPQLLAQYLREGRLPNFARLARDGVLLGESAPTLRLKVMARDAAHNEGVATAIPAFSP